MKITTMQIAAQNAGEIKWKELQQLEIKQDRWKNESKNDYLFQKHFLLISIFAR